ncbi:MAG: hypothetical protein RR313_08115 [Anaerovoracaceae bacterium]
MTVYFAKLNLVSDDLFKLYTKEKSLSDISNGLYLAVNANKNWKKESVFYDDGGEPHYSTIEYSLRILRVDSSYSNIEGWLYKKSDLYYNIQNEKTKVLERHSTENTEAIRFTLSVTHGFVAYNTTTRFGYKEFIEAFVSIVNLGEDACKLDYRYNISLCNSGIGLDDIKNELKHIGKIKELRIKMQPPNPSEDLLADLQQRSDGIVKEFKAANVTEMELFYSTKGTTGINIDAPFINEKISDIQGLYSTLPVEESTKKGYVTVNAVSVEGKKYSSGDSKPLRIIVESVDGFFEACIAGFRTFFQR